MDYAELLKQKMNKKKEVEQPLDSIHNKDRVLIASKIANKGAMHGWAENGLPLLDLGNGYGLKIVSDESNFRTVELYQYAINTKPRQQTWIRTKKQVVTKEVPMKPTLKKVEFETKVEQKNLFG